MYPTGQLPTLTADSPDKPHTYATSWSSIDLLIKCNINGPDSQDPIEERNLKSFVPRTKEGKALLHEVSSYSQLVFESQQRTCIFLVILFGDQCRLFRFDRAGTVVTHKFNWRETDVLVEFLWRYSRSSDEKRGHDTTAVRIPYDSDLARLMQRRAETNKDETNPGDYVRKLFEDSLDKSAPWWKLTVHDVAGQREFLVAKPHFSALGLACGGTRGYVAIDAENPLDSDFYYLKDTWRFLCRNVEKEGDMLLSLNLNAVPHVPTLLCHGDVPKQETRSQVVWKAHHVEEDIECPLKTYKHYRIVVHEVGKPLSDFSNSRQLVYAIACCVLGMW